MEDSTIFYIDGGRKPENFIDQQFLRAYSNTSFAFS